MQEIYIEGNEKMKKILKKISDVKKKVDSATDIKNILNENNSIVQEKLFPNEVYIRAKVFNPIDLKPKWYQYKKGKEYRKTQEMLKTQKHKIVLARIEMNNGRFREFLTVDEGGFFIFNGSMYIFDIELKYYIIDRDIWAYDFHESISLPIKKKIVLSEDVDILFNKIEEASRKGIKPKIEANEIKKIIENSNLIDVESSLNPTTLKRFTDSEVIKQVLQGAMLGKIFKVMIILIIIITILVFLTFIVDLYHSGVFDKIKESLHG